MWLCHGKGSSSLSINILLCPLVQFFMSVFEDCLPYYPESSCFSRPDATSVASGLEKPHCSQGICLQDYLYNLCFKALLRGKKHPSSLVAQYPSRVYLLHKFLPCFSRLLLSTLRLCSHQLYSFCAASKIIPDRASVYT